MTLPIIKTLETSVISFSKFILTGKSAKCALEFSEKRLCCTIQMTVLLSGEGAELIGHPSPNYEMGHVKRLRKMGMGRAWSVWQRSCEFLSFCNILFKTFVLTRLRQRLSSHWLWSNFEMKNKRFARSLSLSRNATPIPRQDSWLEKKDDFKRAKRKVWCCSLPSSYIFMLLKLT